MASPYALFACVYAEVAVPLAVEANAYAEFACEDAEFAVVDTVMSDACNAAISAVCVARVASAPVSCVSRLAVRLASCSSSDTRSAVDGEPMDTGSVSAPVSAMVSTVRCASDCAWPLSPVGATNSSGDAEPPARARGSDATMETAAKRRSAVARDGTIIIVMFCFCALSLLRVRLASRWTVLGPVWTPLLQPPIADSREADAVQRP